MRNKHEILTVQRNVCVSTAWRHYVLPALATLLILSRYFSIKFVPDFYLDEQEILAHVKAIIETRCDSEGNRWPLYVTAGGGLSTYAFLYPMAFFCSVFGDGVVNARFVLQTLTIIACFLTARGMWIWTGRRESFWYTLFIALTLPWGFIQANRIWDPAFVPIFFSIFFFSLCKFLKSDLEKWKKIFCELVMFGMLVMLAVVYPSCRIPAVAMCVYVMIWGWRAGKLSWRDTFVVVIWCILLSAPTLYYMLFVPEFNDRAAELILFGRGNVAREICTFIGNFLTYLLPTWMFVTGDEIYRHNMSWLGALGTINIPAFIAWLRKKWDKLECFLLYTILWTFAGTSLTDEYHPHTLRTCLAWVPFAILLAGGVGAICYRKKQEI